jgi:hypothetical protein
VSRQSQEILEEHLLIRQDLWRNGVQFLHNQSACDRVQRACVPPRSVPCGKGGKISALRCGVPHLVLLTREVAAWQEKAAMLRLTRVLKRYPIGRLSLYLFASSYTLPWLRRDLRGSCSGFHRQLGRIADKWGITMHNLAPFETSIYFTRCYSNVPRPLGFMVTIPAAVKPTLT